MSENRQNPEEEENQKAAAELEKKPMTCFQKFKELLKSLGVIAHAKRSTGALYVNGKNYYASLADVICSLLIIVLLVSVFVAKTSALGSISSVANSPIVDQEAFFNDELSSVAQAISGHTLAREIEVPEMQGQWTLVELKPGMEVGYFPLYLTMAF